MKEVIYKIEKNEKITRDIFELVLSGNTDEIKIPGRFVNIKISGCFLRRPMSVCDADENRLTLVYKVVGEGTERLSLMKPGEKLNVLTGLGNGFNLEKSGDKPLLIGGGSGVPPMYFLCRKLREQGKDVKVVLGFNSGKDMFYQERFGELGAKVFISTADGTVGKPGFVMDVTGELEYSFFYACGPEPMFRALAATVKTEGQYCFEERMGCGFGACMGCSCKTLTGSKRICKDGPVMESEEIVWGD